ENRDNHDGQGLADRACPTASGGRARRPQRPQRAHRVRRAPTTLRHNLIALTASTSLDDHDSPGEATLQVLHGRVRLTSPDTSWDGRPGDHLVLPGTRHRLHAVAHWRAQPPRTACTPSTTASPCSPSPNLFSSKANPPWPRSASNKRSTVTGPI